jgi:hypothetical protein
MWVVGAKVAPQEPYFTAEVSDSVQAFDAVADIKQDALHYQTTFDPEHGGGGYDAPIRWYIASLENINEADEKGKPAYIFLV